MEFGIYTLADLGRNPFTGEMPNAKQRLEEIIELSKMADDLGIDAFGVGEHHRLDYAVSAVPVVLSHIAAQTKKIRLTSTTTVLSTVDPVRLYEDFATLDLLSNGRAEIMAGRGAFIESFLLFGYDVNDYNELFEENLALFQQLNQQERVSWQGNFRAALRNAEIAPRAEQSQIPLWIGVGGTPASATRAGKFGTGMALAILGGTPYYFEPLVKEYKRAFDEAGHPAEQYRVAVTAHAYISDSPTQARDEFYPFYNNYWTYVNAQRGQRFHMSREGFNNATNPQSALMVGSSEEIVEKILMQHELLGNQRFMAQLDIGAVPFKKVQRSLELLATKVMPAVKKHLKA